MLPLGKRWYGLAMCALSAASLIVLVSCDGYTHIDGVVKDNHGIPIPEVEITLADGDHVTRVKSAADGRFTIGITHAASKVELKLSTDERGYEPFHKTFSSRDPLRNLVITLDYERELSLAEIRQRLTKGLDAGEATHLSELMCRQLPNSAAFPLKSEISGDDVHDTLVLLGNFAVPCLIDRITDYTWMPDPRSEPLWGDFRAGDAAFFILCDSGVDFDVVAVPMLNPEDWKGVGVYAYFDWINKGNHRKRLQATVRQWIQEHPSCCSAGIELGKDTQQPPSFRMPPEKPSALQRALAQLKPGMNEALVRRSLPAPDLEIDVSEIGDIITLNRGEKTALVYLIEKSSAAAQKHDFRQRDFLRDRYVIIFLTEHGKLSRVFSNAPEVPAMFPGSHKLWFRLIFGDEAWK